MCKYCKKLKEIKDLDEKSYRKVIQSWKRRDYKARQIISCLIDLYAYSHNLGFWEDMRKDAFFNSVMREKEVIVHALDFLSCDYVGK